MKIGRRTSMFDNPKIPCPLARQDIEILATYNTERARGILHTQEWRDRMARWQADYDTWMDECARAAGTVVIRSEHA